jgi:hypothetical protein
LSKCFNFGEKYHISGKFLGVSGKNFSSLGKIGVCPEKFFYFQNATLTENFCGDGEVGWGLGRSPKKFLSRGPKVAD